MSCSIMFYLCSGAYWVDIYGYGLDLTCAPNGTSIDKKDQHWTTRAQSPASKEGIKRTRRMSKMSNMQEYKLWDGIICLDSCSARLLAIPCWWSCSGSETHRHRPQVIIVQCYAIFLRASELKKASETGPCSIEPSDSWCVQHIPARFPRLSASVSFGQTADTSLNSFVDIVNCMFSTVQWPLLDVLCTCRVLFEFTV